jgi:23S rRNA (uracil1939-C5)-methyltransferase
MSEVTLPIDHVGVRGDGIGHHDGKRIFVPFAAPGDVLSVKLGSGNREGVPGEIVSIVTPGARATPLCPHFGDCGGCALQHLSPDAYAETKVSWLRHALAQQGLGEVSVAPLLRLAPQTRRRARFSLEPRRVGFHARASHRIVDMRACFVLHPKLFALVEPLRQLSGKILGKRGEGAATLTLAQSGVAVLLDLPETLGLAALEALAEFATGLDLTRLAWRAKDGTVTPVALRRKAQVAFSGVIIDLPEDSFLQASEEADRVLTEQVMAALGPASRIADLYAGLGTFTFALAKQGSVHAVEGDAASVTALRQAALRAKLDRVTAEQRDLAKRPLSIDELASYDSAVFDPPRVGAAPQCRTLALSSVKRIIAVSCSPASFARDARMLVDGGYRLETVQPVDAFIWSAQLELVAAFSKP